MVAFYALHAINTKIGTADEARLVRCKKLENVGDFLYCAYSAAGLNVIKSLPRCAGIRCGSDRCA